MAQARLDIARRPSGERWSVPHDTNGMTRRVERMQTLPPARIVLAAPGGRERLVPSAWATAGRPGVVVHPRQGRTVARATGP